MRRIDALRYFFVLSNFYVNRIIIGITPIVSATIIPEVLIRQNKPRIKKKRGTKPKCVNEMIPKFSHKSKGKVKSEKINIYKPKSSRLRHLEKID